MDPQAQTALDKVTKRGLFLKEKLQNMIDFIAETWPTFQKQKVLEHEAFQQLMEMEPLQFYATFCFLFEQGFQQGAFSVKILKLENHRQVGLALTDYLERQEDGVQHWINDGLPLPQDMQSQDLWKLYRYFLLFYNTVKCDFQNQPFPQQQEKKK